MPRLGATPAVAPATIEGVTASSDHPLIARRDLERLGHDSDSIGRALVGAQLERLHRGWYARGAAQTPRYGEDAHRLRARAVALSMRGDGAAISHASAAALWGLPLFRLDPSRVHTTLLSGRQSRSGPAVLRHRDRIDPSDVTELNGILLTSLERTVVDVTRSSPPETGLACADAALRRVAWDAKRNRYDEDEAAAWHERMRARLSANAGARGIRRARQILPFADGRAQLPGESVSRLYLQRLGFAPPRLQVPVSAPSGREYLLDFGLDDVNAWGEFDGRGKYLDPQLLGGRTPQQALLEEKMREDWIRGTTQRRLARWEMVHLRSPSTLAQRLAAFNIHPAP